MNAVTAHVHVLGSIDGYRTLACSPGVATADVAALEVLGFGQTDDAATLSSLASLPAGMGRPLPSGAYALTRCMEGPADSAGRRTLRFMSLVMTGLEWSETVCRHSWSILVDASNWTPPESESPGPRVLRLTRDVATADRDVALAILSAWSSASASNGLVVVTDEPPMRAAVASIASFVPPEDRRRLRWGVGLLSSGAPVDICTLSASGDRSGRRRLFYARPGARASGYSAALAQFWPQGGQPPFQFIDGLRSAGDAAAQLDAVAKHQADGPVSLAPKSAGSPRPLRRYQLVGLLLLAAAVMGTTGAMVAKALRAPPIPAAAPNAASLGDSQAAPLGQPNPRKPREERVLGGTDPLPPAPHATGLGSTAPLQPNPQEPREEPLPGGPDPLPPAPHATGLAPTATLTLEDGLSLAGRAGRGFMGFLASVADRMRSSMATRQRAQLAAPARLESDAPRTDPGRPGPAATEKTEEEHRGELASAYDEVVEFNRAIGSRGVSGPVGMWPSLGDLQRWKRAIEGAAAEGAAHERKYVPVVRDGIQRYRVEALDQLERERTKLARNSGPHGGPIREELLRLRDQGAILASLGHFPAADRFVHAIDEDIDRRTRSPGR